MPKILVIDDDPFMRRMIARALGGDGHTIISAEDGVDGVAKHRAEAPDLVITDMMMPKQDGIETIRQIRERTPDARIIAASGGGDIDGEDPLAIATKLGATDILHKPFSLADLFACVSRALGQPIEPVGEGASA